jgi:DNA uptake protein ComE-like DNA-binding protein
VLFKAVEEADREKISQLLDEDPTLIDAKDAKGHTPLHIAVFSEDPPMVELLVERGANLRRADRDWNATPLETAHNMFLRVQNSGREAIYSYLLNLHDDSLQSKTELGIHITGAVHEPGDYRLGGDARLADAIFAAGGPSQNADTHLLKYDAKLRDGQQIFIPQISAGTGAKKLLLFEGFDNDTIDDNVWQGFSPDKLVARNGFLDFNGALKQRKFIYTHDSTFSDVEMFSDFKILVFTIAFRLRLQDPEHCYGVQYDLRDPTSIEFVTFLNGPNDAKRTYIETERIPEKFEWQRMKVEVKGFTFKAYLGHHDGDLHHVATWEDPDKTYRTGAIGFRVDGSEHTQFDNVMVTTL